MAWKVLVLFGTRPELIKLAPVIHELEADGARFRPLSVTSAQHTDLLYPLADAFNVRIDRDLGVMEPGQTPSSVCARVLARLDPLLVAERPDLVLVQGDTSTTVAGALAAFHRLIPVGHVEAGLRSGSSTSPHPEEMNRRLVSRLATYHFAATPGNRDTLLAEGVDAERVFLTGNPVVDSLHAVLARARPTPGLRALLEATAGLKRVVVTTHRRESLGRRMIENLRVLRGFVERHADVGMVFPVHPNPGVRAAAEATLSGHPRIRLCPPLNYDDFVILLTHAWLIVSDSGGIQEEAPTLGKALLVLRDTTERPEAVEVGVARLVGADAGRLAGMLEDVGRDGPWTTRLGRIANPFGDGNSGARIVEALAGALGRSRAVRPGAPVGS